MTEFREQLSQYQRFIEEYLQKTLGGWRGQPQDEIYDAMGYSLMAGGKRLRPVLTLAFAKMCGGETERGM